MKEVLAIYEKFKKEVRNMIRSFFLILFIFLLGLIMIMMAFSAGWIKIVVNGDEIKSDIQNVGKNVGTKDEQQQLFPENSVTLNRSYQLIKHVLMPGETLYDLEKEYGTNWKVIQKVNQISNPNRLRAGMIILIPVKVELG